ncbi:MAG: tRNA ((1)-)-methyltransferase [Myxococcaceae bacterium]|nr:tRNA ((1)-)-methyltransferase [Myxococcaceae bacterium]
MRFEVITIFPELFESFLEKGLVAKAHANRTIEVVRTNPRDFSGNKHRSIDDAPYGGGSGMVMMPGPILEALESRESAGRLHRILLTPQGKPFTQATARRLASLPAIALVCGRYEGVDERVREAMDEQISLGDFVMTGGEVAAMAVIEATARLLPGVLGNIVSTHDESHAEGLLEYPHYTRPPEFRGQAVPEILLSGDHAAVDRWRRKETLRRTRRERPDLFRAHTPSALDRTLLSELAAERGQPRAPIYIGLVHHPIRDREGQIVATAVTNLDVHDLARSSRSYGLDGYYVITPITAQRELVLKILDHWVRGSGKKRVPERAVALSDCQPIESIEAASKAIAERHGSDPRIVVTAARLPNGSAPIAPSLLRAEMQKSDRPWLILFGTGHGLAPEVLNSAEFSLPPIRPGTYNHLSVRAACAITLDRLFGDEGA